MTQKIILIFRISLFLVAIPFLAVAQKSETDSLLTDATLPNVVNYALKHQPFIQQSMIDQEIVETKIQSALSSWYPQINFNGNLQHNFLLQPNLANLGNGPQLVRFGATNTSLAQFTATQNIFNRDVLMASKTAKQLRTNALQTTISNKITLTVNVTKAFYDVLATQQQIKVGQGDVARLKQSLDNAYQQYVAGLVDKIDYKRATITLNNTVATMKSNQEILNYKTQYLKSLMGYPIGSPLKVLYDSIAMENETQLDTLQSVDYKNRIDYKLLQTQINLQEFSLRYARWSYLPTVALNGSYNFYFLSNQNQLSDIYKINSPYAAAALTVTIPIFQGGLRRATIKQQKWTRSRLDWNVAQLKNSTNVQYAQALSFYKSNLIEYRTLKENVVLAKEVYDVVQLQYKSGVKTYLDVITAETDLRTARVNYYNALYSVLSSKIDVQNALGQITY